MVIVQNENVINLDHVKVIILKQNVEVGKEK